MFIDEAKIHVAAGGGGNGCVAFRREKFVPRGGPSGGDGGRGGDIILLSDPHMNTLLKFRYNPEYRATRGGHGEGSNCHGKDGADNTVTLPVGTVVYDLTTGEKLWDFDTPGMEVIAAKGGRGGRGNARFATSIHQAPRKAEPGTPGVARDLRLELKLLADVGLVGFPNVGKSLARHARVLPTTRLRRWRLAWEWWDSTGNGPLLWRISRGSLPGRTKAKAWAYASCGTWSGRACCST